MKCVLFFIALAACKRGPPPAVECTGYDRSLGMTPGVLTVHPETVFTWSCGGKKHEVACHIEDTKHACTCRRETSSGGLSTDAKFDADGKLAEKEAEARAFANQHCGWNMTAKP